MFTSQSQKGKRMINFHRQFCALYTCGSVVLRARTMKKKQSGDYAKNTIVIIDILMNYNA